MFHKSIFILLLIVVLLFIINSPKVHYYKHNDIYVESELLTISDVTIRDYSIQYTIYNNSDESITVLNPIVIEQFINNRWFELCYHGKHRESPAVLSGQNEMLAPKDNKCFIYKYPKWYKKLKEGSYRLIVPFYINDTSKFYVYVNLYNGAPFFF